MRPSTLPFWSDAARGLIKLERPRPLIGYVVNTYPRASHTFIRREIAALEAQGWSVHRFAMRGDPNSLVDPLDAAEHRRTERILEGGAWRIGGSALRGLIRRPGQAAAGLRDMQRGGVRQAIYHAEAARVAERVRSLGVTHLHAHFGTNSTDVARYASRLAGIGYSFTVHGPEEFDAPVALRLGEKIADARFAVAISSFGRSQLCRWVEPKLWERIKVVHCGIETARFPEASPLPPLPVRLIAIGRFAAQKGFPLLLPALASARRQADIRLTLVGDGELRAALEAQVVDLGLQHAVRLTGWLGEEDVRAQLRAAHALVLPSFAEGLPVVLMEAMAAGRPALATAIAGIPELVLPGETGWLIPSGDADALANGMLRVSRSPPDDLARMGVAARARVLARHDVDVEAAKLGSLFLNAIQGQNNAARM